jgi:hypothetical protein
LPKTYLTKKGPLLLFSEDSIIEPDFFPDNDRTVQFESSDLKTISSLRKSILEFGSKQVAAFGKNISQEEEVYAKMSFDRANTLDSFSFFREHKLNCHSLSEDFFQRDSKIRPGYSAKRYLSSLARRLGARVMSRLTVGGQIREENLFEASEANPAVRQRIDDDLSRVPPAYRIQRQWVSFNLIALKGYRFYRTKSEFMQSSGCTDGFVWVSFGVWVHVHNPRPNTQKCPARRTSFNVVLYSKPSEVLVGNLFLFRRLDDHGHTVKKKASKTLENAS